VKIVYGRDKNILSKILQKMRKGYDLMVKKDTGQYMILSILGKRLVMEEQR